MVVVMVAAEEEEEEEEATKKETGLNRAVRSVTAGGFVLGCKCEGRGARHNMDSRCSSSLRAPRGQSKVSSVLDAAEKARQRKQASKTGDEAVHPGPRYGLIGNVFAPVLQYRSLSLFTGTRV